MNSVGDQPAGQPPAKPRQRNAPRPVDIVSMFWSEAKRRLGKLLLCALLAGAVYAVPAPDLTLPMRHAAFIFVLAAGLWVTEGIPLFATSLLLVGLEVLLLARPGTDDYKVYFGAAADPVVVLFFGGFLMARAATRYKLHLALAGFMLNLFGTRPRMVLLGLMLVTAAFAMWMSATATTAMMLAIAAPLVAQLEEGDPLRKALILGVAFAASIGGIATPIGSPPNAVAVGAMRRLGEASVDISVPQWMMVTLPLMVVLLAFTYLLLVLRYQPRASEVRLERTGDRRLPLTAYVVATVFAITVLLWLTGSWHGMPAAVVALLPAVAFTTLCVIDADDLNSLEWNVLILIAGGIALSSALNATGLDKWLVAHMPFMDGSPFMVVAVFSVAMFIIASFMSHTVAVNLLLPVALSVAATDPKVLPPVWMGFVLPLVAAVSISFPVSTPPNAMAYATGEITSPDITKTGGVIAVVTLIVLIFTGHHILRLYGLI